MRNTPAFLLLLALGACGDDATNPIDDCDAVTLPLTGEVDGPTITALALEVQSSGIVVLATATDPQGTPDLLNVTQSIAVFPDRRCGGTPVLVEDDLAGSGVEESFGTAVDATANASWYNAIANAESWPIEVDFRDAGGKRATGRVFAPVVN